MLGVFQQCRPVTAVTAAPQPLGDGFGDIGRIFNDQKMHLQLLPPSKLPVDSLLTAF